jgi:hypothetical protein
MKQTLVVGSTVVDVIIKLPNLPRSGEDINIGASEYRIGGCAYNVFKMLRLFKTSAVLCSPVGTGIYGRVIREHFEREGLEAFVSLEEENGYGPVKQVRQQFFVLCAVTVCLLSWGFRGKADRHRQTYSLRFSQGGFQDLILAVTTV